jgi:hypothetical protein
MVIIKIIAKTRKDRNGERRGKIQNSKFKMYASAGSGTKEKGEGRKAKEIF